MPDAFMPDVQVDIAFNAGYTTPAASRVWTDVSQYVELSDEIDIDFGRQDERSTADANQMTLTLDNSDGRFTAFRAASPYYPNVKVGRPIRVRVTPPGGSTSTRFVGFVDEWPVEWEGTDAYAKAKIRASSRLARLGLSSKLRSMPEMAILASKPAAYWTLGDPSGSIAASESSGFGGPQLVMQDALPPTFGSATGSPTDGLTAADFAGVNRIGNNSDPGIGVTRGFRASVRVTALGASDASIIAVRTVNGPAPGTMSLRVTPSGLIAAGSLVGPNINDGLTHDVAFIWDASTASLVVDGVVVSTGSTAANTTSGFVVAVTIGDFTGTLAHVAIWNATNPPTVAVVQGQAALMTAAGSIERTDQRLIRILGWAGVPATEVVAETGVETMTWQQTAGAGAVDALRDVESTEGGVLYDGPDGSVRLHNRAHRYLSSPAATLNMASQHVGADYLPKLDRTALVNDATVENRTTGESARVLSEASQAEYGVAAGSAASIAISVDSLQQKAAWLIALYADPRIRVPSLTVDVLAHQGLSPSAQTLLALTIGDVLGVTNTPTQADSTSTTYFVEGYRESIGPESYEITFNLSPTYLTLSTFVLDSATRGVLDAGILAY